MPAGGQRAAALPVGEAVQAHGAVGRIAAVVELRQLKEHLVRDAGEGAGKFTAGRLECPSVAAGESAAGEDEGRDGEEEEEEGNDEGHDQSL